jgi:hypothetical protein
MHCIKDPLLVWIAIGVGLDLALGVVRIVLTVKFKRLLASASQGAADHFEKLRKVRQVGV